jgi:hypothetical protein
VVPSEDYSHAPPCFAAFFREGRKTETEPQSSKKKTMKTNTEIKTESGLKNRPEPLSFANRRRIDFTRRKANRSLTTDKLLALLVNEAPRLFGLAEVVGQWVWIQFATSKRPPSRASWPNSASIGTGLVKRGSIHAEHIAPSARPTIPADVTAAISPPPFTVRMRPNLRPVRLEMRLAE